MIGAGGTRCPVYRELFRELNPRASELQIVTLEHEIRYDWQDCDCHLWFFDHGLPGYSWYVPKERGWLNVGLGGIAERMKRGGQDICAPIGRTSPRSSSGGLAPGAHYDPGGYSYYLRGRVEVVRRGNAFITGDAAGLATRDLGEGIGPAVRSGLRAARADPGGRALRARGRHRPVRQQHRAQHARPPGACRRTVGPAAARAAVEELHMAYVTVINEHQHVQQIVSGHHHLTADEALAAGGSDAGFAPRELLLASLGADTAVALRRHAMQHDWTLGKITVGVRWSRDAPARITSSGACPSARR